MNENTEPSVPWSAFKKYSSNSLGQVRYKDWDELRGVIYNTFGWYMKHLSEILELADYQSMTPDDFIRVCLNTGLETFKERYENVTRGDRL